MNGHAKALTIAVLLAVVVVVTMAWLAAREECKASGGVLVGDSFGLGWECVEPRRAHP